LALVLVAMRPMIVLPAVAQTPGGAERARVANTVEKLDGDRLTVQCGRRPHTDRNAVSRCHDLSR